MIDRLAIGLVDHDERVQPIVEAALPPGVLSKRLSIPDIANVRDYWVVLVSSASLQHASIHGELQRRIRMRRSSDLVLITRTEFESQLRGFAGSVRLTQAKDWLWPVTRSVGIRSAILQASSAVESLEGLIDPLVQRAQKEVLASARPFTSVTRLTEHLGCNERTLRRHWHDTVIVRGGPPLRSFVESVLLLRYLGCDFSEPRHVTRNLWGLGPDRGCDIARRLVGASLSDVQGASFPTILVWFRERIVSFLVKARNFRAIPDRD
jgi:hypothetical protein